MAQWKDILGFEAYYEVSDRGQIRRKTCVDSVGRHIPSRIKQLAKHKAGYWCVDLYKEGKRHRRYVHRLVLEAFIGPAVDGTECCHRDGNPENNCVTNLYWGTHSHNMSDRTRHGRHKGGNLKRPVRRDDSKIFESIRLAARLSSTFDSNIRRAIVTGGFAGGYQWEYV